MARSVGAADEWRLVLKALQGFTHGVGLNGLLARAHVLEHLDVPANAVVADIQLRKGGQAADDVVLLDLDVTSRKRISAAQPRALQPAYENEGPHLLDLDVSVREIGTADPGDVVTFLDLDAAEDEISGRVGELDQVDAIRLVSFDVAPSVSLPLLPLSSSASSAAGQ